MSNEINWQDIGRRLRAPFGPEYIDFLPKGKPSQYDKILVLPYIDARAVMDRLDDVVGPGNWSFDWQVVTADDSGVAIKGTLSVLGVSRSDAGEAGKEEEAIKSGVSDAFKRCAVHFGIGRYLYSLPQLWVKYRSYTSGGKEYYAIADKQEAYRLMSGGKPEPQQQQKASDDNKTANPNAITEAQVKKIHAMASYIWGKTKDSVTLYKQWLKSETGKESSSELTKAEAKEVIDKLQVLIEEKEAA